MTDPSLREKLRLIRGSDHPASPWARNVIQTMDEIKAMPKGGPVEVTLTRRLGMNVAMMERAMTWEMATFGLGDCPPLSAAEIAAIFGLGEQSSDHQ